MDIHQAFMQIKSAARCYAARSADGLPLIPPEAQRPLYLIGPPGVGKTEIVRQAAIELGIPLVSYTLTHHTRQSALGLPRIVERSIGGETRACTEYTMSEILAGVYRRADAGAERGILFLDEINCVSETLTPALLELLQHKRFGEYAVPEGWMIVCAGNPEAYNRSARAFDPVTLDRLRVIRVEPKLEVWLDYAAVRGVHSAVRGYLRLQPGDFCTIQGENVVTPRSWTDLSDAMRALEALGEAWTPALFEQYLQCPEAAERFALYCALCRGVAERFSLDSVLQGPDAEAARHFAAAPFDEALCAAMLLAAGLNARAEAAGRAEEIAGRLGSFVEGALRVEGDGQAVCREQLSRMERALEARRSAGILDARTEAGERALFAAVRAAMGEAAASQDTTSALRRAVETRSTEASALLDSARTAFENGLDFARMAFVNPHVRTAFIAELEHAPASLRLMKRALPEAWAALCRESDPELRAAELRRRAESEG